MKHDQALLLEEDIHSFVRNDPAFLAEINEAEAERVREEAKEEAILQLHRAEMGDLFGGESRVWDFIPRRVVVAREQEISDTQLALRLPPARRRYHRDSSAGRIYGFEDIDTRTLAQMHLRWTIENIHRLRVACKTYYATWLWLRLPYKDHPFSFERCCATVDVEPADILRKLELWRKRTHTHKQWVTTERQLLTLEIAEGEATAETVEEWTAVGALRDRLVELNESDVD